MAEIGSISVTGYAFYNGGWSDERTTLASSYSYTGSYVTVDIIKLPTFTNAQYKAPYSFTFAVDLLKGSTNTTTTSGTLYVYLCSSKPIGTQYAKTPAPNQQPPSSIGSGSKAYSGLTNNNQTFSVTVTTDTDLSSGGTYYLWIQTSSFTQVHYGSSNKPTIGKLQGTLETFTISYDANGGSGAPDAQTKTYGTNLTLSSTKPTRTGYDFKGWGTSSSTTTVSYAAGGTYTANASATLYAVWSKKTYTVSYDANGGSNAPDSQTKTHGTALTLSSTKPTRTGYSFQGWGTSASDTSVDYAAGGSYTTDAAIKLYAIWRKTITIKYDANGGTGAPSNSTGYIYNAGTSVSIKLSTTTPTRDGYEFLGWNTSSAATSSSYTGGSSYSFSSDTTLYAVWKVNGAVKIYVKDVGWKMALPYIYVKDVGWKQAIPYTYVKDTGWKIGGG